MKQERKQRTELLLGKENVGKIEKSSVMVIGLGGVGGYTVEALARCGTGKLILVDFDTVSESNINRQIIADTTTVGRKKTDVFYERIKNINPECEVVLCDVFVSKDNAGKLIEEHSPDFVVDAIDNVSAKIAIAEYTYNNGIPAISSMGTGNKTDPKQFRISDIYKTSVCPLARVMRKELKERKIEKYDVLFSEETPIKTESDDIASISFVPSVAGLLIAEHTVKYLIKKQ